MGKVQYIKDGLKNLVANLGTARDKASHNQYFVEVMGDEDLAAAYRGSWLPRKIVDVVSKDACRRWREWQASGEQITKIVALEKTLNVQGKILEALTKARLFGGAAVYIGTDAQDLMQPLSEKETIKHLTVITRRNLTAGDQSMDPADEDYGKPAFYTVAGSHVDVHPTRLILFYGAKLPDEDLASASTQKGWGDSVLLAVMDALKNADSTVANVASLVFEAKVDVIKIPDFMNNLADPEYEKQILNRVALAATAKGINGALLIDADEDYQQKSASFSSLKDILMAMMQVVSGASDIPMTRLLGMSPGGMAATGESDTRNYYDNVSGVQELEITPAMERFDKLLIRNALGGAPNDVWYVWASLWQTTDSERAEIGNKVADTVSKLATTQLFNEEDLAAAAVNMLVEQGIMPGLEQTKNPEDNDEDETGAIVDSLSINDGVPRPLYVSRRVLNAADLTKWAAAQGIENVVDNMHVTVAHSSAPVDWLAIGESWDQDSDGRLRIAPGGPRDLDQYNKGALVLEFVSSALKWRHRDFKEAGASWDYEDYKPHVTIAYNSSIDLTKIAPYTGPIVLGPEIFEDLN